MKRELIFRDTTYGIDCEKLDEDRYVFDIKGDKHQVEVRRLDGNHIVFSIDGTCHSVYVSEGDVSETDTAAGYVTCGGLPFTVSKAGTQDPDFAFGGPEGASGQTGNVISSPIPGKVIAINVQAGDEVKKGACLLIIESMKMENSLVAPRDAVVEEIRTSVGELVESSSPLIILNEE